MSGASNPLWPAYLTVLLTVAILLTAIVVTVVTSRYRLARAQASFTAELVRTQDAERQRISAEVHDDFGGNLTILREALAELERRLTPLDLDTAPLRESFREVDHLAEGVRNLAHRLHPTRVDKAGLMPALRELADQLALENGLSITLEGLEEPLPGGPVGWALYRIAQEATRNAAAHGQASQVWITLRHLGGTLELEVRDDGRGFDSEQARATSSGGIGLRLMHERASLVGGTLQIASRIGAGTTVRCQVPLSSEQPSA